MSTLSVRLLHLLTWYVSVFLATVLMALPTTAEASTPVAPGQLPPSHGSQESLTAGDHQDSGLHRERLTTEATRSTTRKTLPLRSGWTLSAKRSSDADAENGQLWKREVELPSPWEAQLGTEFDQTGVYSYQFPLEVTKAISRQWKALPDARMILRLEGVATEAQVFCNQQPVGDHTGAWTPWECDLSSVWHLDQENEITIEVDEKVGHHTQGFLPIVAPHFGGIWKEVSLQLVPTQRILADQSLVLGSREGGDHIDLQLETAQPLKQGDRILLTVSPAKRLATENIESMEQLTWQVADGEVLQLEHVIEANNPGTTHRWEVPIEDAKLWSCQEPWLYDVHVQLLPNGSQATVDTHDFRTGIRSIETQGHQLRLNGSPINVRGLLNWGYSPPSTAPTLSIDRMLHEIRLLKSMDLNLMKFCLYVPPKEYLELCDLMGVMAWMEYPTWHAQLVPSNLEQLSREYREFTNYDRNHPSVVLRSLTCETGSSADLNVIRSLYDLVHQQIPNCVVEDDSSWISWNRVSDFWDDHPYGNNHTWVQTLQGLKDHIKNNGAKPLILGEAIAADTWPQLEGLVLPSETAEGQVGVPQLHLGSEAAAAVFQQEVADYLGDSIADSLLPDSIRYAALMRKFQIEVYRREVPWGGFVLSVIRDFPLAPMGILDIYGQDKFRTTDLTQRVAAPADMLLLQTADDRRSFPAGSSAEVTIALATPATAVTPISVSWKLHQGSEIIDQGNWNLAVNQAAASSDASLHPQITTTIDVPQQQGCFDLEVQCQGPTGETSNRWRLWAVPTTEQLKLPGTYFVEESVDHADALKQLLDAWGMKPGQQASADFRFAGNWSLPLWQSLQSGQTVVMLPNGKANSFTTANHWFLRGAPLVDAAGLRSLDPAWPVHDLLLDLQHFDLAGPVQTNLDFWQETTPVLMLWDMHDITTVKKHGLLWISRVGKGKLAVSMLDRNPQRSTAGPFLLFHLLKSLTITPTQSLASLSDPLQQRLESELQTIEKNLTDEKWRLKADPEFTGLNSDWQSPTFSTDDWKPIRIDQHWEGQDNPGLDGWAWYATEVQVPADWQTDQLYLCFTGVDDHYRAFVNGEEIGSAGDIETKETAFEMRSSYRLPKSIRPGDRLSIRIAVYDWYGAGGIFRPIFLRTTPLSDQAPLLQR